MALESWAVHLIASARDGCLLPDSVFLSRLVGLDQLAPDTVSPSRSRYETARVTVRAGVVTSGPFKHSDLERAFHEALATTADWLASQDHSVFEDLRAWGASAELILDIWVSQDQFEVILPPALMLACSERLLPIHIITND